MKKNNNKNKNLNKVQDLGLVVSYEIYLVYWLGMVLIFSVLWFAFEGKKVRIGSKGK